MDEYIVMPNHIHCIICINCNCKYQEKGDQPVAPTSGPQSKSIGSIIAGFKSIVTTQINTIRNSPGEKIWQRNYYDHIIRNEKSLNEIRVYIRNNPATWDKDEYNKK
ncbi:MAG: transposase [Candidatus Omnitrophica bacterium]|nr:transposase [Candidatus Omnitrophota bacterium]